MSGGFASALDRAIEAAWALMADIGGRTADPPGTTRAAWGAGEQVAAEAVSAFARAQGLDAAFDGFGNIHATLPGQDRAVPAVTTGSHLDSVPHGGNYDGLAGVAAGFAVLAAARQAGLALPLRALALRCEESPWYGTAYLGSRLLLGLAGMDRLGSLVRFDSGRTLAEHMRALDYAADRPELMLGPHNTACFLELHIEQGPLLQAEGVPVGIATATRGNVRFPRARCLGEYAHSAALPRPFRRDAVLAVAELALGLDRHWAARIAAGDADFVSTVGIFTTDPLQHAMTKVAGEVGFSLNIGATQQASLDEAQAVLRDLVARIEADRGVAFELGEQVGSVPGPMDDGLMRSLEREAARLGIGTRRIPTVGHDAAMFRASGIPAAMVLTRNANGSHNPREALAQADFAAGVRVLAGGVLEAAGAGSA